MPEQGVYLLSGTNGSGKTSLLACLRRIGHAHAFPHHFASSQHSDALDNFEGAEITYTKNQQSVTYAYGGERWVPTPRSNNNLLNSFGYPSVLYIGATADRITPRPEDFNIRRIRPANQQIIDAANRIFGTAKYNNLKSINLTRGSGNAAFLLQLTAAPRARYCSERNLSLGELCILKLIKTLMDCDDNSLVLIDELELALHPRVQLELLAYLKDMAAQKSLTVIFSTHSVTLLKGMERSNIFFLERNDDGVVSCRLGCYPTYIFGNIAYEEECAPDVVIYVEDDAAAIITGALIRLAIVRKYRNEQSLFPTVQTVPIGTFISVIRFLHPSRALLPSTSRAYAVLDGDVKTETVNNWRQTANHTALAEFQLHENNLKYLPWTPEVGLAIWIKDNLNHAQNLLRTRFNDHRIIIYPQEFLSVENLSGPSQRSACKKVIRDFVTRIHGQINRDYDDVKKIIFEIFATEYFAAHQGEVTELFGPLI